MRLAVAEIREVYSNTCWAVGNSADDRGQSVPGKAPIAVKAGAVIHQEPMQVSESENVGPVKVIAVRTSLTNERTLQDAS